MHNIFPEHPKKSLNYAPRGAESVIYPRLTNYSWVKRFCSATLLEPPAPPEFVSVPIPQVIDKNNLIISSFLCILVHE